MSDAGGSMSETGFSVDVFAARREKLRKTLHEAGHSALLVSHAANRYYLSGFELHDAQCNESSGMLFITTDGKDKLLTDPRFFDAARRLWPIDDIFIYSGKSHVRIREFLAGIHSGPIAFESQAMSVATHDALREALALVASAGLVEQLRRIKEPAEIELLDRSLALNEKVMRAAPGYFAPGASEAEIAWGLERLFRDLGASELAFPPIVAVDRNAALPHAVPGPARVTDECMVLVDMGGRLDNYNSDQTRTFWVGSRPHERFQRALEQTKEAQARAIAAIRPGVSFASAYRAAWTHFERHGVEKAFTHGLGHGVGLETHEAPNLSPLAQGTLEPGMVVTVEPGLYYSEWGGVRWEHTVVVTEDGCRVLGQNAD